MADHRPDLPPAEPRSGCAACSYSWEGCSFCSGRSAIEIANERTEVAGVPVVDLTEVMEFQRQIADPPRAQHPCERSTDGGHTWEPSTYHDRSPVAAAFAMLDPEDPDARVDDGWGNLYRRPSP